MIICRPLSISLSLLICLTACSNDNLLPAPDEPLYFTSISSAKRIETISAVGTDIHIQLPEGVELKTVQLNFKFNEPNTQMVYNNDTLGNSGIFDLRTPIVVKLIHKKKAANVHYRLSASSFTDLPKVYITTKEKKDIDSDTRYTDAFFRFDGNGCFEQYTAEEAFGKIRGRGNSTWTYPKKPYKIRLDEPSALWTGASAHRNWVLLANCADKSLIRNQLAFDMSRTSRLEFTPYSQYVELFVNGKYQGNYLLCDQVELETARVEGTSLIELDMHGLDSCDTGNPKYFKTNCFPFKIRNEACDAALRDELKADMEYAEGRLFGDAYQDPDEGFRKYFDEDSFIRWYLINELFKNCDAQSFSSIYYYQREPHGKWYMGPVWDFDLAAGNMAAEAEGMTDPTGWYVFNNGYFRRMCTDTDFYEHLRQVWLEHRAAFKSVIERVPDYQQRLTLSAQKNFGRWKFKGYFWYPDEASSFEENCAYVQRFLNARFDWMDQQFQ